MMEENMRKNSLRVDIRRKHLDCYFWADVLKLEAWKGWKRFRVFARIAKGFLSKRFGFMAQILFN